MPLVIRQRTIEGSDDVGRGAAICWHRGWRGLRLVGGVGLRGEDWSCGSLAWEVRSKAYVMLKMSQSRDIPRILILLPVARP